MEERELFAQYRETHDRALRNEIVGKYLDVAAMIARKFTGRGVEYDDLFQVASLALMKGVDRFDETKGVKFSTFITPTIAGEIKNYFRDRSRLIHLPRRVAEIRAQIRSAADEIFSRTGKSPSAREIAETLHVSEEDVLSAMEAGGVVSLDRPLSGEEETNYYDLLPAPDDAFEKIEERDVIRRAMQSLNETEREIVDLRYIKELSQTETAKRMNVSQMYISRMERKILEKLREKLKKSMTE